ncbi:MAG: 4-hydroxy-tetrahydrodipicolinate reductase [Alphaproteobacteria bacterium]|nr:4-hydroxy-tetrahydrodipicolinate reductase [Alphaproteobacteria bacterium]
MGSTIAEMLRSGAFPDMVLAGGSILKGDAAPENMFVTMDPADLFARSDAVIDFTTPEAGRTHAMLAIQGHKVLVVGTSGLSADDEDVLSTAAGEARVVYAPNMSLGVNLLFALAQRAAAVLGPDWDAEILDVHHAGKVDAPSATSYALAQAVADGRQQFPPRLTLVRKGRTGAREAGSIGFAVQRGGDVVAENAVTFFGTGERLELVHRACDRAIFARGALAAARWAAGQPPGLYSMTDVLGL